MRTLVSPLNGWQGLPRSRPSNRNWALSATVVCWFEALAMASLTQPGILVSHQKLPVGEVCGDLDEIGL